MLLGFSSHVAGSYVNTTLLHCLLILTCSASTDTRSSAEKNSDMIFSMSVAMPCLSLYPTPNHANSSFSTPHRAHTRKQLAARPSYLKN